MDVAFRSTIKVAFQTARSQCFSERSSHRERNGRPYVILLHVRPIALSRNLACLVASSRSSAPNNCVLTLVRERSLELSVKLQSISILHRRHCLAYKLSCGTMADVEGKRLTELRVIDLKTELERRGLDKSGNKAALLERLSKVRSSRTRAERVRFASSAAIPLSKGVAKFVAMLTLSIQQHIFIRSMFSTR